MSNPRHVGSAAMIRAGQLSAVLFALHGVAAAAEAPPPTVDPNSFLASIHRHSTLTSTVPPNGDQNPYAIVIAPVSSGAIKKTMFW